MKTTIITLLLAFIVSATGYAQSLALKKDSTITLKGNYVFTLPVQNNVDWYFDYKNINAESYTLHIRKDHLKWLNDSTAVFSRYAIKKDTVVCWFREITGIVKGELMGQWVKGWVIKPKGSHYFISSDTDEAEYALRYLYADKKTKVTNTVIQYYY